PIPSALEPAPTLVPFTAPEIVTPPTLVPFTPFAMPTEPTATPEPPTSMPTIPTPTPRPTFTPRPAATRTFTPTIALALGRVQLLYPARVIRSGATKVAFVWKLIDQPLAADQCFELVFWDPSNATDKRSPVGAG